MNAKQMIFTVIEFRISGSLRNRGRGRPASNKQQNVGLSPSETNRDLLKRLFPDLEEQRVAHLWVDDLVSVKITAVQKPSFVKSFFLGPRTFKEFSRWHSNIWVLYINTYILKTWIWRRTGRRRSSSPCSRIKMCRIMVISRRNSKSYKKTRTECSCWTISKITTLGATLTRRDRFQTFFLKYQLNF